MDITLIGMMVAGGVLFLMILFCMVNVYQKCGPNQAMIITGYVPGGIQVVRGGGAVVWPLINQKHTLSLEVMTVELPSRAPIFTSDSKAVQLEGLAHVKVGNDDQSIINAAEHFLNKSADQQTTLAREILVGHLREIVATLTLEELTQSLGKVALTVQEISTVDLAKKGLTVELFTIKEVKGTAGQIGAVGQEKTG
jgi:flotillin